ncbi:acetyltransferase [Vibrio paracholerae]|uniref:Acetyltransferase n=1 Tax=Vibrio paracholerae TaxID=650003 RepID=A0AAX1QS70_9VIBR|nr:MULTISPECIES: acetyltransferase [Vibrio]MBY3674279.1 acetyltransferase [Vibrio cholerae]RBM52168.1 acetyltransferase [Vibrio paracholerae]RBM78217.1 acetyltransferase [Vibrio paracholerae]TQP07649.1 acetyltransferase [Vibrio cholerae]TQP20295.1 acetyltransferase [Vibrio cholerae]
MVTVVVFEFCVMRCQPLRRALCVFLKNFHSSALIIQT